MNRGWLRYGLVGNTIFFGFSFGLLGYLGWIIYDIGQNQSTKMDEDLAKQFFTFSDEDLKESARKARVNFLAKQQQRLTKVRQQNLEKQQKFKKAEYI